MKKRPQHSMRIVITLFIIGELLLIDVAATLFLKVLQRFCPAVNQVPEAVWMVLISVLLGSGVTALMVRYCLRPMVELGTAMRKVAQGDFTVRLDEERDFPEIRQIKKDFNLMTKELGATEILQTEFVSNVSHEFKTPINAIEGYTMLLQSGDAISEEQEAYIQKILLNTGRLSALVGNMLLLSKIDNQNIQTKMTTYRLDEQIRQSILFLEARWTESNTDFDVEMDRIEYTGPESLMLHVWNNLIENAIKYGPQNGLIRMKLTEEKNEIIFVIEDEGPGIGKEEQKHIFDRFYQADSSRKGEGNGLGLALVRQILGQSNGTIDVENLPERGCRFTVRLPHA